MTELTAAPSGVHADAGLVPSVDVRPILVRNAENGWERTEQVRTNLYHLLDILCAKRGIEALVLQSYPYVHPAWVKFESWQPTGDPGITARTSMQVTISTKPYHRFEAIYKVDWEKHGRVGAIDHLYRLDEPEMGRMIDLLSSAPSRSFAVRRVRRILKPVQLRQRAWQLWRPRNKVLTVRRDWLWILSAALVGLGVLLVVAGTQTAPPETQAQAPASTRFPALVRSQPVSGMLDGTDPALSDGRFYEVRSYLALAGETIAITMRSGEFDTYLILGRLSDNGFVQLQTNAGKDGTNSRLEFVASASGEYVILASSLELGKTGTYSLVVQ